MFAANGWGHGQWRNGIFPFVHYHSMIHEALGIARGRARVRFGGDTAKSSSSAPATSRCCRPAPAISGCRAARPGGDRRLSAGGHLRSLPRRQPGRPRPARSPPSPGAGAGQRSGARQERAAGEAVARAEVWTISADDGLGQLLRLQASVIYVNARHRDVHYRSDRRGHPRLCALAQRRACSTMAAAKRPRPTSSRMPAAT